jgi:hypothetical protein
VVVHDVHDRTDLLDTVRTAVDTVQMVPRIAGNTRRTGRPGAAEDYRGRRSGRPVLVFCATGAPLDLGLRACQFLL